MHAKASITQRWRGYGDRVGQGLLLTRAGNCWKDWRWIGPRGRQVLESRQIGPTVANVPPLVSEIVSPVCLSLEQLPGERAGPRFAARALNLFVDRRLLYRDPSGSCLFPKNQSPIARSSSTTARSVAISPPPFH
jgi:hypothetical protein